jgi:hypothetical protein
VISLLHPLHKNNQTQKQTPRDIRRMSGKSHAATFFHYHFGPYYAFAPFVVSLFNLKA